MAPPGPRRRAARWLTEALAPSVLGVLTPVVVGAAADDHRPWRGALLGLLGAGLAVGVPYAVVVALLRRGLVGDHHVPRRQDRPRVFAAALLGLGAALGVLGALGAPTGLRVLLLAMAALVAASAAVSLRWKASVHAAAAAGCCGALVVVLGPWALLGAAGVVALCWARVEVGDHTPAQVVAGAALGAAVLLAFLPLVR